MPTTTKGRKVRREATQSSPADKDQRPIVRKAQGGSATVKGRGKSANGQLNPKDKAGQSVQYSQSRQAVSGLNQSRGQLAFTVDGESHSKRAHMMVASTSTIGTDGGHTAVREGNADSASSIKKKSGKKGKNQSKEQEASAPKAGTEGKESKIEERSKAAYPSVTKTSASSKLKTASLLDLDPDDFMAGLVDAGLEDDVSDGNEEEHDDDDEDKEKGEDQEGDDSADSDDEDANEAAMDLNKLADTDPEFYSFLRKEEPTLLEFDPMDDSDDSEDEAEGERRERVAAGGSDGDAKKIEDTAALLRKASRGGGVTLTMPLLKAMREEAFERKSVKGVKRMIKAFRCGCHLGDEAGDDNSRGVQKFRIPSSEVYNELMVSSLEGLHPVFMDLLFPDRKEAGVASSAGHSAQAGKPGGKRRRGEGQIEESREDDAPGKKKTRRSRADSSAPTAAPGTSTSLVKSSGEQSVTAAQKARKAVPAEAKETRGRGDGTRRRATPVVLTKDDFRAAAQLPVWKAMQPALYSFLKSLLHVLEELKDRALLAFLLSRLEHYTPLLVPFPGLARVYLKALLGLWGGAGAEAKSSGGGTEEEGEEAERVRLLAYLRVRQMAAVLPFPFVEGCMNGLYLAFAKRARAPPASTAAKVSLRVMEGCVVELFNMDVASAYQNGFLYIRQLSLLLRRSMQQKTKDSFQAVRRWQVLTCLRVWTGVLAAAPAEDELKMLIFPLAQVIEGIIRLCATLRHSPFAFQLVRMRQRLAAAAGLYVPCSSPLLAVLQSPALFKKATASTDAPPNIPAILRLGKNQVDEGRAQGAVVAEALRLLNQEMDLYRYSAAFPELVVPVLGHLRKFARATKVSKWRMIARGLMETLEARGTWAADRRKAMRLSPAAAEGLEALRPEGAPTMRERLGASEAEVERIDDDATNIAGGLALPQGKAHTKKIQALVARSNANDQTDSESENASQSNDSGGDDSADGETGLGSTGQNKPGKGKMGVLSPATRGDRNGLAEEFEGDIAAPDMVEDLGTWSDDEEW